MGFSTYDAVRLLRTPQIRKGRRRYAGEPEPMIERLEAHAYRPAAIDAMVSVAMDPDFYYRADLDSSSVVVDLGAFKGEVAQTFVDLYGCKVHSFEPHPRYYAMMAERFEGNDLVSTYRYGLGHGDARLEMKDLGLGSTVHGKQDDSTSTIEVEIRDVAAVLDELGHARIDYLKVNIEGAEFELLDRLFESGWNQNIRYMLIQFHEWYPGAYYRRWRSHRQLRTSHEMAWGFDWIHELWCNKDQPPPSPKWTPDELEQIRASIRARAAGPTT